MQPGGELALDAQFHEHPFENERTYRSVVKIFATSSTPNYQMPWANKPHRESTGSGFAIVGRRLLTNAHVVADVAHCQVRKHGDASKHSGRVVGISHECDLALIEVDDDEFWDGLDPLHFGEVPALQDAVTVVGYPTGGDNMSITGGVVSRVDVQQYAHGAANLVAVQIDAAINPGNSGGPAMMDGLVVGVAFQNLIGAENQGFVIPVPIIEHFLNDIANTGKCLFATLGVLCQPLENEALRTYMRAPKGTMGGVLVNKVLPLSSASGAVEAGDVIMKFDGHELGCDGTVIFRGRERTSFDYLVARKCVGERATLEVLRDGQLVDVEVTLREGSPLVPVHNYDKLPSYFIFGGFVFVNLMQPYLHEFGDDWYNAAPRRLVASALNGTKKEEGAQVVVLSQVLAHKINNGYVGMSDLVVRRVGDTAVKNLAHLAELLREGGTDTDFVEVTLEGNRKIIMSHSEAVRSDEEILARFRVPSACSDDLLVGACAPAHIPPAGSASC